MLKTNMAKSYSAFEDQYDIKKKKKTEYYERPYRDVDRWVHRLAIDYKNKTNARV